MMDITIKLFQDGVYFDLDITNDGRDISLWRWNVKSGAEKLHSMELDKSMTEVIKKVTPNVMSVFAVMLNLYTLKTLATQDTANTSA